MGSAVYAPVKFYIELMRSFMNDMTVNGEQLVDQSYMDFYKDRSKHTALLDGRTFARGIWTGQRAGSASSPLIFSFKGAGGVHIVGDPESGKIMALSRRSVKTPGFANSILNLNAPLMEFIRISEFQTLFGLNGNEAVFSYNLSTTQSITGVVRGVSLSGTPLYDSFYRFIDFWKSALSM
jgi:hypothetical protein